MTEAEAGSTWTGFVGRGSGLVGEGMWLRCLVAVDGGIGSSRVGAGAWCYRVLDFRVQLAELACSCFSWVLLDANLVARLSWLSFSTRLLGPLCGPRRRRGVRRGW